MRRYTDKHNNFGTIWSARVGHFTIELVLTQIEGFEYDGDDEDGETQDALNSGDFVAFDSEVRVMYGDDVIGADYLGSSVYKDGETLQFIRDGYFRDMLSEACNAARNHVANLPRLRRV